MTTIQKMPDPGSLLIDARAAWTLCGLSKSSWYKNLSCGRIPRPVKIGGALRWRRRELEEWIAAGCPARSVWEVGKGKSRL